MAANKLTALEALERVEAQTAAFSKTLHETMKEDLDLLKDYLANSERKPTVIAVRARHAGKPAAIAAREEEEEEEVLRKHFMPPLPPVFIPYDDDRVDCIVKNTIDDKINATAKSEAEAAGEEIAARLKAELDSRFGELSAKIDSNDMALHNRLNALEKKTDCMAAKHECEINELKRKKQVI